MENGEFYSRLALFREGSVCSASYQMSGFCSMESITLETGEEGGRWSSPEQVCVEWPHTESLCVTSVFRARKVIAFPASSSRA